jgi:hypothetical protein
MNEQRGPRPVASKSQTHETFARVTGGSPATYAKMDRAIAAEGFGLPGGKGGGKNTVHVNTAYLRNMLIGSASYLPSDAASVVTQAMACDYLGSDLSIDVSIEGGLPEREDNEGLPLGRVEVPELNQNSTFGKYILQRIEAAAKEAPNTPQTMLGRPIYIEQSCIRVDFEPFTARVEWRAQGGLLLVHHFVPRSELEKRWHMAPEEAAREMNRIRRSSILPASLIFTAADLLRDSQEKRGVKLPFSGQGGASSSASAENEKTPGLPEPGVSLELSQPCQPGATGHYNTPETMRECANYQAHIGRQGSFPLMMEPRSHEARP